MIASTLSDEITRSAAAAAADAEAECQKLTAELAKARDELIESDSLKAELASCRLQPEEEVAQVDALAESLAFHDSKTSGNGNGGGDTNGLAVDEEYVEYVMELQQLIAGFEGRGLVDSSCAQGVAGASSTS